MLGGHCAVSDNVAAMCTAVFLQKSNSKYGNEHEAVAVYSMMRGVEKFCPIYTLCIGNAFGEAALLLAAGSKVRVALAGQWQSHVYQQGAGQQTARSSRQSPSAVGENGLAHALQQSHWIWPK